MIGIFWLLDLGVDLGADSRYFNKIAPGSGAKFAIDTKVVLVYVRKSRENPGACSLETK